eukprot:jgi/Orpsp1_1/1175087/evm.model.c7180000052559.1
MDPPLISDGQTRACNPEKSFEKLLPFPKSPIGCLVYLIKNEKSVDQEMLKWLNQLSLKLSEMRKCDFELLNSFPVVLGHPSGLPFINIDSFVKHIEWLESMCQSKCKCPLCPYYRLKLSPKNQIHYIETCFWLIKYSKLTDTIFKAITNIDPIYIEDINNFFRFGELTNEQLNNFFILVEQL